MPRHLRLPPVPFAWYYVTLYAESGRALITAESDLRLFVGLLQRTLKAKGAHLHAGCVTARKAHLAIQSGAESISAITRNFCHEYARQFNERHVAGRRLFRSHPRVLLIQHTSWLVPLVHFIHWTPRLRPTETESAGWLWNSDLVYRGRTRHEGVTTHVVLRMLYPLPGNLTARDEAYRRRFDQPPNARQIRLLTHGSPEDPRILGDARFIAEIWRATRQQPPRQRKRGAALDSDVARAALAVIEAFVVLCDRALPRRRAAAWRGVLTLENLCSSSRVRPLPMLRALSASYLTARRIATPAQAAHLFTCHPKTLSAHRRRHQEALFGKLFGKGYASPANFAGVREANPPGGRARPGANEHPGNGSGGSALRAFFAEVDHIGARGAP